ncbi:HAD-IA family hydrolase [Anaerocolumna sp. MB42-C2]|uniref:HAD-IA family hydrolase n=1 Tax=Anaerocolumna sp. MB42-C2 TaxID=3070997 RepID=UPI0027E20B60|nr:HAD-IA family hydrolase [Anaerocolumna sp. MB42-C2]WMJ87420.1 HAD-IA family hydrolase [Anaerocolumna sp. MB42-C2]
MKIIEIKIDNQYTRKLEFIITKNYLAKVLMKVLDCAAGTGECICLFSDPIYKKNYQEVNMITTLVFDYGGVLAYPKAGNWFITQNTRKIIGLPNYMRCFLNYKKIAAALEKALKYLNDNHVLHTEQDEYLQFIVFYKIFFKSMGFTKDMTKECQKLAYDIVYNDDKVKFYDDVITMFTEIKKNYKIVILSDTWPSLKRILKNKGILPMLDGLIMSCDYGATKETTKLFEITTQELNLIPEECVFIDDSISNLENAEKAGYNPVLMDRNDKITTSKYPLAKNISDVIKLIGATLPV